jgi:hypothetical protein
VVAAAAIEMIDDEFRFVSIPWCLAFRVQMAFYQLEKKKRNRTLAVRKCRTYRRP